MKVVLVKLDKHFLEKNSAVIGFRNRDITISSQCQLFSHDFLIRNVFIFPLYIIFVLLMQLFILGLCSNYHKTFDNRLISSVHY